MSKEKKVYEDFSLEQVAAFRTRRQFLGERQPAENMLQVAGALGGVQAQVLSAAHLSLWTRVEGVTPARMERALWQERELVKIWSMRGTLHLLPAAEWPFFVSGLNNIAVMREQNYGTRLGVSTEEVRIIVTALVTALEEGPLSRRELADRIEVTLGPQYREWIEHSWGGIVKQAVTEGLACFGPARGQEVTFVRTDKWLPQISAAPEIAEAETALLRRYLRRYAPASIADYTYWMGVYPALLRPIWEKIMDELAPVSVAGKPAYILQEDLPELRAATPESLPLRLLPNFDVYLLAHKDKSQYLDKTYYKRVFREAGWVTPVLLINGMVAGVWSYTVKKKLIVNYEQFYDISPEYLIQLESEVANLSRYFGLDYEFSVKSSL